MEDAPENGKELSHSAHVNGKKERMNYQTPLVIQRSTTGPYPETTQPSSNLHTMYKALLKIILPHFS